jgi:lactate dehydrogenase-like 2-hydroxyacid dehydrogenase
MEYGIFHMQKKEKMKKCKKGGCLVNRANMEWNLRCMEFHIWNMKKKEKMKKCKKGGCLVNLP